MNANRSEIEEKTFQILERANIPLEPPIDVIALARKLSVEVYHADFKDNRISGFITVDPELVSGFTPGKRGTIIINSSHSIVRQRFTVGHELGHLELGHLNGVSSKHRADGMPYDPKEEKDANEFSASLLMPRPAFEQAMLRQKGNIITVALTFGVSVEAASIRAANSGILTWENKWLNVVD